MCLAHELSAERLDRGISSVEVCQLPPIDGDRLGVVDRLGDRVVDGTLTGFRNRNHDRIVDHCSRCSITRFITV